MSHEPKPEPLSGPDAAQFSDEVPTGEVAPWTEIDPDRYMPRRIRGSYQGRALG